MTVNAATGLISGTLTYASAGTLHGDRVGLRRHGVRGARPSRWTVTNVNQPPTLTDVADRTDPENTVIAIALAGADLDAGTTLTYSAAPLPAGVTLNPATRPDQRHAHLHERGRAHGHRVGVGRHGLGRADLHVDRHQRQSAADAHRRARSHRPGEHRRRDRPRGRRPGCGDNADLQRDAAPAGHDAQPDDRPDQRHAHLHERRHAHGRPCRCRTARRRPTRPSRGPSPTSISRRRSPTSPTAPTRRMPSSRSHSRAPTWIRGRR